MSSSSNNSWTIVTPEETAAETLRPERTEHQDEPSAPTQGGAQGFSEDAHQPTEETMKTVEETITKPCEESDLGVCLSSSAPLDVLQEPVPEEAQAEDTPVDTGQSHPEQEAFSDSYSHLGPSSEDCPPLSPETLGQLDSGQEQEEVQEEKEEVQAGIHDQTLDHSETQELQEEETEPAQCPLKRPQDPSVEPESLTAQEAEPEVRRRPSLLEKLGRHEEEEEAEEDFQLPQREEDSGITLNKCILGAVILLGLGTIFISGVVLDLEDEGEYPSAELKDPEKREWINPATEAESAELLNKLNKGNEQIATLQSQLQSQKEELKVSQASAAEGSTERLRQQEVQQEEHSRFRRDLEKVPELQKELQKMRTELQSVSVLKKEVEGLRSTLTHLRRFAAATPPPGGRTRDYSHRPEQQVQKNKHDRGLRDEWKDKSEWKKEKKLRKDGGKVEGKEKEWKRESEKSGKYEKYSRDEKKDKSKRGDEGKPWKEKYEKKEWAEKSDKKSKKDKFKEESKHDKYKEDKEWRRDFKEGKHKGPGDKEKKKGKDEHKEGHQYERKHWKDREEHGSRNERDTGEKSEKKWKKKEDGRREEEEKHQSERKSDKHKGHRENAWSEKKPENPKPKNPKPSVGQPEYWSRQRERLQHSSRPPRPCDSPDSCAKAEGVRPVSFEEFETILQIYLSKAITAGVNSSQTEELKKLAAEMFQNAVFPHEKMSFQDYVEDVGDILEDLVDVDEDEDGEEDKDSAVEDEMEGFEKEVMLKFALPGSGERGGVKGGVKGVRGGA